MRRNKDAYMNYVCPHCFNTLNKCTCKLYPPYHLIWIDKGIQEHIRVLNEKGYKTTNCCESHKYPDNLYIMFVNSYGLNKTKLPSGFKFYKKSNVLSFEYNSKITQEEFEIQKKEKLSCLLEWCKNLDKRED